MGTANATKNPVADAIASAQSQREDAMNGLTSSRDTVCGQLTELAGQLAQIDTAMGEMGVEEFSAPDLSAIDYLYETEEVEPAPARKRKAASGEDGRKRPKNACTLPDAIIISMSQTGKGDEYTTDELVEAIQKEPVGYKTSGSNLKTQVSQSLTGLVESGHIERPSRGRVVLTANGRKAAVAALKDINAG